MAEINIIAGSHTYPVECEEHELEHAKTAAAILNAELANINNQAAEGRELAPSKLFMLAGLRISGNFAEASGKFNQSDEAADSSAASVSDPELLERLTKLAELAEEVEVLLAKEAEIQDG